MAKVSNYHGFIIRKDALSRLSISNEQLESLMEGKILDQDDKIITFGPTFGKEAANNLSKKIEDAGLVYVDDYFIFEGDFPDWITFSVEQN